LPGDFFFCLMARLDSGPFSFLEGELRQNADGL
jgi:hypothetical protein